MISEIKIQKKATYRLCVINKISLSETSDKKHQDIWLNEELVLARVKSLKKLANDSVWIDWLYQGLWLGMFLMFIAIAFKPLVASYPPTSLVPLIVLLLYAASFYLIYIIRYPLYKLIEKVDDDYESFLELKTGLHAWRD